MTKSTLRLLTCLIVATVAGVVAGCGDESPDRDLPVHRVRDRVAQARPAQTRHRFEIPALLDPNNVYAADGAGDLSPVVRHFRPLVYVPNSGSHTVDEIDPSTFKIVRHFAVGALPQHVVPSYNLRDAVGDER